MTLWHRIYDHLHVLLANLGLLDKRLTHPEDRALLANARDAAHGIAREARRDSEGDDMADIETQKLATLEAKAAKRAWDAATLKQVQAIWALVVGSAVIASAIFYVLPHLAEDGLIRDDVWLIAGFALFGSMIAFPSAIKQGIGSIVLGLKAWRSKGKE